MAQLVRQGLIAVIVAATLVAGAAAQTMLIPPGSEADLGAEYISQPTDGGAVDAPQADSDAAPPPAGSMTDVDAGAADEHRLWQPGCQSLCFLCEAKFQGRRRSNVVRLLSVTVGYFAFSMTVALLIFTG